MAETWWVNLQFAAVRCRTVPFGTILSSSSSQRQRQPTPCCFSAAVSLQVMRWLSGLFQKLRIRVAEGMTKSGECLREEIPRAGVRRRFKRAISHVGD